jgi:cytochrome c
MAFNCKVFDGNGKLKKIVKINEVLLEKENIFLEKKSTKRAVQHIRTLKEPKCNPIRGTKFYDSKCVVCGGEFHPRHARSKYCSHECQKKITLRRKKI